MKYLVIVTLLIWATLGGLILGLEVQSRLLKNANVGYQYDYQLLQESLQKCSEERMALTPLASTSSMQSIMK